MRGFVSHAVLDSELTLTTGCEFKIGPLSKDLCPFLSVLMSPAYNNTALIDRLLEGLWLGQQQQLIKGLL